ncbi:DUF4259 domain-containing protein [Bremerella alba]|uniref:DUF4259 domain-containing protein n=1 Tax=Bremerella alba TaxID=980252 RepID=A0A7V8V4A9_9BACT|nr:DUF4259 domain-containing protein [Bremerella alba]MBA2114679.1 hypothetical protein [Bremerella alba]
MGAWGHEIFDNDAACDWLDRLLLCDDLAWIETTLEQVNQADGFFYANEASAALAACETLAHLRGRPGLHEASLDELKTWVDRHRHLATDSLVPLAGQTLTRISSDDCELKLLWQQGDQYQLWVATVEDVGRRIV